ncbi:TetR/AcrR family transcriptional regulator [Pseudonocardia dioxanivorans]|uniref:TetR/AcrR family transcriptional regulator n=1 Tax=Pseudonocardia dioxanivorans TaxID=240495 RepID=UPI000CD20928|nr:TetR/AcrR family transcriptional regulator [Pseudonocardia dioxanivorans]GJF05217.1 putative transcriptional regulator, TetR family protein [Pseudonocardia sp. D17]
MTSVGSVGAPVSRVARKRAERQRLMERVAAEVFAERGYERASLEEIAARLDMRGASLYHYYPSKEDLFLAAVQNATAEVVARLREVASSGGPAVDRLRRLFVSQALVELRDYPSFAPLFLMHLPDPVLDARVRELSREHAAVFREVAAEVAGDRGDALIGTYLALGSLAYLRRWYDPAGALSPEELAEHVAASLVNLL